MFLKKLLKTTILSTVIASILTSTCFFYVNAETMRDSQTIVNDMGVGLNIGNSLESHLSELSFNSSSIDFETAWGNPVTTKSMIDEIKKAGFKTVRIPITWGPHIGDAPEYNVNSEWMDRVQEVVDYCMANDLYVIINVHHDSDWCIPTYSNEYTATKKLTKLWTQIAIRFKDYNDHLIFETLNEPRIINSSEEWSGGSEESRDVVNKYNQAALNAIRATGGNNKKRSVMIPTYAASSKEVAINGFTIPKDDHIIVSLHAYAPYWFAMATSGEQYTEEWGSEEDKKALDKEFDYYYNTFVSKGIPVVIGEFGSINKNNTSSRVDHARYFVSAALKRNMPCIWWDNNTFSTSDNSETFGLLNRNNLTWQSLEIKDALINGYTDVKGKVDSTVIPPSSDSNNSNSNSNFDNLGITITEKNLNSWYVGYQLDLSVTNTTDSEITDWCIKIKKSDLSISVSWDADLLTDDEYIVLSPKPWKSTLAAGESTVISFQGQGSGSTNFDCIITTK